MAATTTGLTAGAGALGATGDIAGAFLQAQALRTQGQIAKEVAKANAAFERRAAEDAIRRGEERQNVNRRRVADILGKQRAGFAAGNVDVSVGSPADVQAVTEIVGVSETLKLKVNALREAAGLEASALNFESQGRLAVIRARAQIGQTVATAGARVGARGLQIAAAVSEDPFLTESAKASSRERDFAAESQARALALRRAEESRGTSFRFSDRF